MLWAVGMAVGMLLLSGSAHGDMQVEAILFGDLAQVRAQDLALLAGFVFAMIATLLLFGRELIATAFDDEHAQLQGLPVGRLSFLLLLIVALAVVALLSLVGIVLAIALLAIPPLVALRLFRSLPAIVAGGCAVGLLTTVGGLAARRTPRHSGGTDHHPARGLRPRTGAALAASLRPLVAIVAGGSFRQLARSSPSGQQAGERPLGARMEVGRGAVEDLARPALGVEEEERRDGGQVAELQGELG